MTLREHAASISKHLEEAGFSPYVALTRQVLNLAEEVGEFVGAYRRWIGQARRSGTAEEVYEELADVVITAYVTAHELGVDLDKLIEQKLEIVFSRGWKES